MTYVQVSLIFGTLAVLTFPFMLGILGAKLNRADLKWLIPTAVVLFFWGFAWPLIAVGMVITLVIGIYYSFKNWGVYY